MSSGRMRNYSPRIREKLERKGYFNLTKEQRVKAHLECLKVLSEVRIDYSTGEKVLDKVRGEDW